MWCLQHDVSNNVHFNTRMNVLDAFCVYRLKTPAIISKTLWIIYPDVHLFETSASFSMGWAAFMCMSPNVEEEGAMKEDTGTQDTPYTEVSICLH